MIAVQFVADSPAVRRARAESPAPRKVRASRNMENANQNIVAPETIDVKKARAWPNKAKADAPEAVEAPSEANNFFVACIFVTVLGCYSAGYYATGMYFAGQKLDQKFYDNLIRVLPFAACGMPMVALATTAAMQKVNNFFFTCICTTVIGCFSAGYNATGMYLAGQKLDQKLYENFIPVLPFAACVIMVAFAATAAMKKAKEDWKPLFFSACIFVTVLGCFSAGYNGTGMYFAGQKIQ